LVELALPDLVERIVAQLAQFGNRHGVVLRIDVAGNGVIGLEDEAAAPGGAELVANLVADPANKGNGSR